MGSCECEDAGWMRGFTIENQQLLRQYPVVLYIKLERFNCSLLKAMIKILVLQDSSSGQKQVRHLLKANQTKTDNRSQLCKVVVQKCKSSLLN
ncbi:Protein nessun dorma [Trichinella spiralis]|uniref:Protein nessun dorma n=1 Tax=Trichinella spiralis TaxID=6334 RepID=A0ABR3KLE8_TRISP